jgi:steroid delta-isomerase-like uncharacterized protein
MDLETNKAIARRFSQIWGGGDLHIVDELASSEMVLYYPFFPEPIKGIIAFKEILTRFRATFGDGDMQITDVIAEGDRVVLRWRFSATHQGEFLGIPPSGKRLTWTGITVNRIVNGKIAEEEGEEDMAGLFRQLGILPEPPM